MKDRLTFKVCKPSFSCDDRYMYHHIQFLFVLINVGDFAKKKAAIIRCGISKEEVGVGG